MTKYDGLNVHALNVYDYYYYYGFTTTIYYFDGF